MAHPIKHIVDRIIGVVFSPQWPAQTGKSLRDFASPLGKVLPNFHRVRKCGKSTSVALRCIVHKRSHPLDNVAKELRRALAVLHQERDWGRLFVFSSLKERD